MGKLDIDCRTGVVVQSNNYTNRFMDGDKILFDTYSSDNFGTASKKMKAIIFGNFIMELANYIKNTNKITTTIHTYSREDGSFMVIIGGNIRISCHPMLKTFSIQFKSIGIDKADYINVQAHIIEQKLNIDILKTFHYVSKSWEFPKDMHVPIDYVDKYRRFNKKRNDERNKIT